MLLNTFILICIGLCPIIGATPNDLKRLTVIYGTNAGELRVKDITTNTTLKTINVMIDDMSGGLAIDHARETIYFADNTRIYMLYAVDNRGKRCLKGELFTDANIRHIETIFFEYPYELPDTQTDKKLISSLSFDNDFLYATLYDPECNCSRLYKSEVGWDGKMSKESTKLEPNTVIKFGKQHICMYGIRKDGRAIVYKCKKNEENCRMETNNEVIVGWKSKLGFLIEQRPRSDRLFVMQHGGIYVLNEDITTLERKSIPVNDLDILIADARVTKGLHAFDVLDNTVVWGSASTKKLYVGTIEKNGKFITSASIRVLDFIQHHSGFDNIRMFFRK